MKRLCIRWLSTLLVMGGLLTAAPTAADAGIIPWVYDTVFGPVGSIQARRAGYMHGPTDPCCGYTAGYAGGYNVGYAPGYGYRPGLFGLRGWRRGWGGNCCSPCGVSDCGGCSTCGVGYASGGCATGNCANGACSTFYPPINNSNVPSSLAPATGSGAGVNNDPAPMPMGSGTPLDRSTIDGFGPANDGFRPAGAAPAPTPENDSFIPPKTGTSTSVPAAETNPVGTSPAGETKPAAPGRPRPTFGDDEDMKTEEKKDSGADRKNGPRLELHDKIAWQRSVTRIRQDLQPARASATVVRHGLFPKSRWTEDSQTVARK